MTRLIVIVLLMALLASNLPYPASSSSPTVVGAKSNSGTSVTVSSGGSVYFYVATTGGAYNSIPLDFSTDLTVPNNAAIPNSVTIGHSTSNSGSFNDCTPPAPTPCAIAPVIGGIGVMGGSFLMATCVGVGGSNTASCAFNLSGETFIVIVAGGSNTVGSPTVSVPGGLVTVDSTGSSLGSVILAHGDLMAGTYTLNLNFNAYDTPAAMVVAAVIYEFSVMSSTTTGSSGQTGGVSNPSLYGAIIIVVVIVILGVVLAIRRRGRRALSVRQQPDITPPIEPKTTQITPETAQKLQRLKSMLDAGLISQVDYEEQKRKLMM